MKTIWDYPVTYVFGYSAAYGDKFHTGQDRTVYDRRKDIPVPVNGKTIGIAGTTGDSTGIHLHISHIVNGKLVDPAGGGATVSGGKVLNTGYDNANGNYVRVQDTDGSVWVYCHLDSIAVKAGDILQAEDEVKQEDFDNQVRANQIRQAYVDGSASRLAKWLKLPEKEHYEVAEANHVIDEAIVALAFRQGMINELQAELAKDDKSAAEKLERIQKIIEEK